MVFDNSFDRKEKNIQNLWQKRKDIRPQKRFGQVLKFKVRHFLNFSKNIYPCHLLLGRAQRHEMTLDYRKA